MTLIEVVKQVITVLAVLLVIPAVGKAFTVTRVFTLLEQPAPLVTV